MADKRSYTAGHFMLSLDGEPSIIKDFDGGNIKGEVNVIQQGPDLVPLKTITTLKYEPFTVNVGISMGKSLYEWIRSSLDRQHIYKNGYVAAANYDYKAQAYRHFTNALITEISLPAFDAASKETGHMTVKFDPEQIRHANGDGADIKGQVNVKQKMWQPSNFRLRLGDLDCTKISKIDAITIKQSIVEDPVGEFRENQKCAAAIEFPNIKITGSMATIDSWAKWHEDFVINGNCGQDAELSGAIEFLSPNGKEVLGSLDLFQVGIFSLTATKLEAAKTGVATFTAECYVERMQLTLNAV